MELKKIKSIRLPYLFIALGVGAVIMMLSDFVPRTTQKQETVFEEKAVSDGDSIEKRIEEIIEDIDGINDVSVLVTYENKGVYNIASTDEESGSKNGGNENTSKKSHALTIREQSLEKPFVKEEILPEIRGIIIAARGISDVSLEAEITEAVACAAGVSINRVKILSKD